MARSCLDGKSKVISKAGLEAVTSPNTCRWSHVDHLWFKLLTL
jgi:hypothetical protein